MQKISRVLALVLACLMTACSGGGGGSEATSSTSASTSSGANSGTGSSSSSGTGSSAGSTFTSTGTGTGSTTPTTPTPTTPTVNNKLTVTVSSGGYGAFNVPLASVTICLPGTTTCQTIDNVLVDTGSYGLRLMASAVSLSLPQSSSSAGNKLATCSAFASGYTWGSVRTADVKLGGETAFALPVQLIADSSYSTVPSDCSSQGAANLNAPTLIAANGILGVGLQAQDCPDCVANADSVYYDCPTSTTCTATTATLAQQVANPVSYFAQDNNGVILQLPSIPAVGQASATGQLVFGIGTQSNNGLGSATVYAVDASSNSISTTYNGTDYSWSFIDSGSNGLFFEDTSITTCSTTVFYCPPSMLALSATLLGTNGASTKVNFNVGNAPAMVLLGSWALSSLAADVSGMFDWGLPFFYGRSVYTAINGKSTPGGMGPYYAF